MDCLSVQVVAPGPLRDCLEKELASLPEVQVVGSGARIVILYHTGQTSFTDTGLTGGVTYYYVVSATEWYGYIESDNSAEVSATPTPGPPPVPTGLSAAASDGQVSLSWSASDGATAYNVKRSTYYWGPFSIVASPTTNSYADTGLTDGTTYYYQVSATSDYGESGDSAQVSATPQAPLPAPTNVTASPGNGQVSLSWDPVSGASQYTVKRSTTQGGPYTVLGTSWYNNYSDYGLTNGTTYYYVITASLYNGQGESPNSAEVSAIPTAPPPAPTGLSAAPGDTQVSLSWTGSDGAASYHVKQSTSSGGPFTTVGNPTGMTYTATGLSNGVVYYFQVTAVGTTGSESGPSNTASARPNGIPAPPATLTAIPRNQKIDLSWSRVPGADSYNLKGSTTQGGPYGLITNLTGTSYSATGLRNGTTYYFVVSAINSAGEGANSGEASATPEPPPAAPLNLSVDDQGNLTWSGSALATGYYVKRASAFTGPFSTISTVTDPAYTDTSASPGVTYFYVVTAFNPSGESGSSNEVTFTLASNSSAGDGGTPPPDNYPYVTIVQAQLPPVQNLKLTQIYRPQTMRVAWDPAPPPTPFPVPYHYEWRRTSADTPSNAGGNTTDLFVSHGFHFQFGTTYTYSVKVVCDVPTVWTTFTQDGNTWYLGTEYTDSDPTSIDITPMQAIAAENGAVDSRLDLRYGDPTPLNHHFGNSTYKGGLYVGNSVDPARVGRSFLKFNPSGLETGQYLWEASMDAYFNGAVSSTSSDGTKVGCQVVSGDWTGAAIQWSSSPTLDPASASNLIKPIFDTNNPATYWLHWPCRSDLVQAMNASQPLSLGLAVITESADQQAGVNSWMYFAKKEFSAALAPDVVYAIGAPCFVSGLSLSTTAVTGGGSLTGTVTLNGAAPAGGLVVSVGPSDNSVSIPAVTVPAGDTSATFTITTSAVTAVTPVTITASTGQYSATAVLTVSP